MFALGLKGEGWIGIGFLHLMRDLFFVPPENFPSVSHGAANLTLVVEAGDL